MKHLKEYKKNKRYYYFRKQKLLGLATVILAIVSVILLGDATVGLLLGGLGLYVMFTKNMVMYDDYYDEVQMKKQLKKDED